MKANIRGACWRLPGLVSGSALLMLLILAVFVAQHRREAEEFTLIVIHARPEWVAAALLLQAGTYLCAGGVWNAVIRAARHRVSLGALARFSIGKLSIDQLIPLGGVSGNLVVFQAMRRLGLPRRLAMEALLVDMLSHYAAYALVAAGAVLVLWLDRSITPVLVSLAAIFALFLLAVPSGLVWLIAHRGKPLPPVLAKWPVVRKASEAVQSVSTARIFSPRLVAIATAFGTGVFLLDAATLWAVMHLTPSPIDPFTAFVALVIGSMAGTISFLPGGIGGFEAGCVLTLHLLGVPVEDALTGTLLLRGLSLWLPLVPGLFLVRRDILVRESADRNDW